MMMLYMRPYMAISLPAEVSCVGRDGTVGLGLRMVERPLRLGGNWGGTSKPLT